MSKVIKKKKTNRLILQIVLCPEDFLIQTPNEEVKSNKFKVGCSPYESTYKNKRLQKDEHANEKHKLHIMNPVKLEQQT